MDKIRDIVLSNAYNLAGIVNGLYEFKLKELEEADPSRKYDKEEVIGISKTVASDIKTQRSRPTRKSIVSLCIYCGLEPQYSEIVIAAAGYHLSLSYAVDEAYYKLIHEHYKGGIKAANKKLKEWGISSKDYLLDYN